MLKNTKCQQCGKYTTMPNFDIVSVLAWRLVGEIEPWVCLACIVMAGGKKLRYEFKERLK